MIQSRPALPVGHGELLVRPAYDQWDRLVEKNRALAAGWRFDLSGTSGQELRGMARAEVVRGAEEFSRRLGIEVRPLGDPDGPVVMTGHQPELYHPGVWVKDFLLQEIARKTGASAIDVVVDSDGFDSISITSPCLTPETRRCRQYLAIGSSSSCYACAPLPDAKTIDDFCAVGTKMLATLPAPSIGRNFKEFCEHLNAARASATSLAELVTFARRRYEARAGTDYSELPVSHLAKGEAFSAFVADIALNAERFAASYNEELSEYRLVNRTRSALQPFPNLQIEGTRTELPLWSLGHGRRETVWAASGSGSVTLSSDSGPIVTISASDATGAASTLRESGALLAPKALLLTLFARVFCCDLFIHGVGGARYDRVTDGVCRRYYGIEPPAFAVASLSMYLPLGAHLVTEEEVAAARERLNRIEHNPDGLLSEVDFDTIQERENAYQLTARKRALVAAIAEPDADKKSLGHQIREVNQELGRLLEPLRDTLASELASLESQRADSDVLTDRTYPFCFWSPEEIADKVR